MTKLVATVVGLLGFVALLGASPLLIDHFVYAPLDPDLTANSVTPIVTSTQTDGSILGGKRKVTATYLSGDGSVFAQRPSNPASHRLALSANSLTSGTWEVAWGTFYVPTATFLGDLTNGGAADKIILTFLASDLGVNLNMTVRDQDGTQETVTGSTPAGAGLVVIPFSLYSGAMNFTAVDSLKFDFTTASAGDFSIDLIQTNDTADVPEPASLTLLGMLGLGMLRWRR